LSFDEEEFMHSRKTAHKLPVLIAITFLGLLPLQAQQKSPTATVPVHMTVTAELLGENKRMPEVKREDVVVQQGDKRLKVTGWTPARGDHAGLELFILIDDTADTSLGLQLNDLRAFINAQPPSTLVGVGYMQNTTVQIAQNFTADHGKAANAVRLPIATFGAFGNPYLSVIDLMNRWPESPNRREVVMVSDGIDRFRGGPRYRGFLYIFPDADSASSVAQRTGTIIDTIFTRGIGRWGRNFWEITNGQNSMAKLSDETGGESYFLGRQNPVSFKPYLDDLQNLLNNQYILEFEAIPGAQPGLQHVDISTPVAGVELDSANSVWVEAK
jgi:hypothetical protein